VFEIVKKELLAEGIYRLTVSAPRIAVKRHAGHFVILIPREGGERIPLTIASSDPKAGTIDVVFQAVGTTTTVLAAMNEGEKIAHLAGPLGLATDVQRRGNVVVVGGGVGLAAALPIAVAMSAAGNSLTSIIGGRSKAFVILEEDFRAVSDRVIVTTDDGSYGNKGFVTDALRGLIDAGERIDEVVAVGPLPMMRAAAEVTRPKAIKTIVSLNPIMVDGTGMCGGCRVTVGGKTLFACVDGPEFDAHQVDFAELASRLATYKDAERASLEWHKCRLNGAA